MVGGLNRWYGIEANALVGAMQILVVHAESGGGRDAQPGEVVADVGRSCDLGHRGEPCPGRSLQQCIAQRRAVWQGAERGGRWPWRPGVAADC